jgi:hypothetical protein
VERREVLKQIEEEILAEQLQVIPAMRLSADDVRAWADVHGLETGFGAGSEHSSDALVTRCARSGRAELCRTTPRDTQSCGA